MKKRILFTGLLLVLAMILSACQSKGPAQERYEKALNLFVEGKYSEAVQELDGFGNYEDAARLSIYGKAILAAQDHQYEAAFKSFDQLAGFRDCDLVYAYYRADRYQYSAEITEIFRVQNYLSAADAFNNIPLYRDSRERAEKCMQMAYDYATQLKQDKDYTAAVSAFELLGGYNDSAEQLMECRYLYANELASQKKYNEAISQFEKVSGYRDSDNLLQKAKADMLYDEGRFAEAWEIYKDLADEYQTHTKDYEEKYKAAAADYAEKNFDEAAIGFRRLGNYLDSAEQARKSLADKAAFLEENKEYGKAITAYNDLGDTESVNRCHYEYASDLAAEKKYKEAAEEYSACIDYQDSAELHFSMAGKAEEDGDAITAFEILKTEPLTDRVKEEIYRIAGDASAKGQYELSVPAYDYLSDEKYKDSLLNALSDCYRWGNELYEQGKFDECADVFAALGDFSTAPEKVKKAGYAQAKNLMDQHDYQGAKNYLVSLGDYEDSASLLKQCEYSLFIDLHEKGQYLQAVQAYREKGLKGYSDADRICVDSCYRCGIEAENAKDYTAALDYFSNCDEYQDTQSHILECQYQTALLYKSSGKLDKALEWFRKARKHSETMRQLDTIISFYEQTELKKQSETAANLKRDLMAENALDEGDFRKAIDYYGDIKDTSFKKEREREAWYLYGSDLLEKKEYEEAIHAFEKAGDYSNTKDKIKESWAGLAESLEGVGDTETVVNAWLAADETEKAAEYLINQGEINRAISILREAGKIEKVKEITLTAGDEALKEGNPDDAISYYMLGEHTDKAKAAWEVKGDTFLAEGKYKEARDAYNEANLESKVAETWRQEGYDQLRNGNITKAKEAMDSVDRILGARENPPYIGIGYLPVGAEDVKNGWPCIGLFVTEVVSDGPAWNAGIRFGDILIAVDDIEMADGETFTEFLRYKKAGERVEVRVRRPVDISFANKKMNNRYRQLESSKKYKKTKDRWYAISYSDDETMIDLTFGNK